MDLGFGDAIAVCLRDIKDSFSSFHLFFGFYFNRY